MSTATAPTQLGSEHLVQFYARDRELISRLADYVVAGGDDVALIVATPAHRRALVRRLTRVGFDPMAAQQSGDLVLLDAAATLGRFSDGATLDPRSFDEVIGGLLDRAVAAGRTIRVYGEMVALLWAAGQVNAALELEDLWNDLGRRSAFTLLCGYPADVADAGHESIERICRAHSQVAGRPAREVTRGFARATTVPAAVRRFIEETMQEWDAAVPLDDLVLIGTELATNAIKYAGSDVIVTLATVDGRVRMTIADGSPALPVPSPLDLSSPSGRGLRIIDVLATSWGFERHADGKTVWAEIAS